MGYKIVERNITVAANYFNVSIFRESWFIEEGILNSTDIDPAKSFFSPNVLHIENSKIDMLVQPPQLSISLKQESNFEEFQIALKIVQKLPHVPYELTEIRITYLIEDFEKKIGRTYFFNSSNKIFGEFKDQKNDPFFGAYLSKDYLNSRLKIDIHPVLAIEKKTNKEQSFLQVECQLTNILNENDPAKTVQELISNSQTFNDYTKSLVEQIN